MRERLRVALPYALIILIGLSCVVVIAITGVGGQRLGWLVGANLQSDLGADYNIQPTFTLSAVDATAIAQLLATDEAGLQITAEPGVRVTVPVGHVTPGGTSVAQVTRTPTPSATPRPTNTLRPSSTPTPTASRTPTRTRTPLPTVVLSPTPIIPTPTFTPPPSDTPEPPPPPPPSDTFTPTNTPVTPTITNTPTNTPTHTPTHTPTNTPATPTNPAPPAPAGLGVVNTSAQLVSLAWSNNSATDLDFWRYHILRGLTSGGPYAEVGTATQAAFVDNSGLVTGTTYYYVVQAEDLALQTSGFSNEAAGTPNLIVNPNPAPDCTVPDPPANCGSAGTIDGNWASINPTQTLILDFGAGNGILDGPGYDLVYYERERDPIPTGVIQMDWVTVEMSINNTDPWYVAFAWNQGSESYAANTSIARFAGLIVDPDPAVCDLFAGASNLDEIPMGACGTAWFGMYGTPPRNTGILIDISIVPTPPPEGYRYIRIRGVSSIQPAEIDGIERLH